MSAERLIEWTGERCVPWAQDSAMLYEHYHRYLWAAPLVAGRRVLDLGSGEGFGASILAARAAEVVGVDVDPAAVAHARGAYELANLSFEEASALDLGAFPVAGFGAVVAFEMVEHVLDHDTLLGEVARILSDDGLLVISTPDRDVYGAATGQVNEFHEHELSVPEFRALLRARFEHVAIWGQRTITGSYMASIEEAPPAGAGEDFFVARGDERFEPVSPVAPIFCIAVASRAPLPAIGRASTLVDAGLELRREADRAAAAEVAERDRQLTAAHAQLNEMNAMLDEKRSELLAMHADLTGQLEAAWKSLRRVEQSVSWRALQRARGLLYGTIGEDSRAARAFQATLRALGRLLGLRSP